MSLESIDPDVLNNYFVESGPNAAKHLTSSASPLKCMPNRQPNSLFLSSVSNDDVLHCIRSLSNKKSCDLDGLSGLVKKIAHSIVFPLKREPSDFENVA